MSDPNSDHLSPPPAEPTPDDTVAQAPADVGFAADVPGLEGPTHSGFVAIVGRPNVGKSTLLNTMLGVKVAPITHKPQTTRRGVRGVYSDLDSGRQLIFVDTPGMHRGPTELDSFMGREIRDAVADVEIVLWVVDLRRPPNEEDRDTARLLGGIDPEVPVLLVGNKLDTAKYPDEAMTLYGDLLPTVERGLMLSAKEDPQGVYDLRDELLERMPANPFFFPPDIRSDQSREAWAADLIRESAMIRLRQEIPYSVAVRVTAWDDPGPDEDEPIYIAAEVWVERTNHRPIAIGKEGRMIREIGRGARKQLEVFLDQHIFLDLDVVVRRDWREDVEALRELGYQ